MRECKSAVGRDGPGLQGVGWWVGESGEVAGGGQYESVVGLGEGVLVGSSAGRKIERRNEGIQAETAEYIP